MSLPKDYCIDKIGDLWTDEYIILCLKNIQTKSPDASLPCDVIADINPYLHDPSNLPEGNWYVIYSKDPKQAELGFWKAKGNPCQIYSESLVIGWRTTKEFYKGQSPSRGRTDWIMQEYSTSNNNISSNVKGASSLCRVFLSDEQGKLQEEMDGYQAMLDAECFAEGDFLEILDLDDPNSSSSSSGNSSCVTPSSDLYFDSVVLLHELEDQVYYTESSSSYKFSVSRPNDIVVTVAAQGSNDGGVSSTRKMSGGKKGKKVEHGKMIKKFFCFMA